MSQCLCEMGVKSTFSEFMNLESLVRVSSIIRSLNHWSVKADIQLDVQRCCLFNLLFDLTTLRGKAPENLLK